MLIIGLMDCWILDCQMSTQSLKLTIVLFKVLSFIANEKVLRHICQNCSKLVNWAAFSSILYLVQFRLLSLLQKCSFAICEHEEKKLRSVWEFIHVCTRLTYRDQMLTADIGSKASKSLCLVLFYPVRGSC